MVGQHALDHLVPGGREVNFRRGQMGVTITHCTSVRLSSLSRDILDAAVCLRSWSVQSAPSEALTRSNIRYAPW